MAQKESKIAANISAMRHFLPTLVFSDKVCSVNSSFFSTTTLDSYGDKFYIIIRGKVEVQIDEFHRNKLITNTVQELGAGSSFGELALITQLPRNATIVCRDECHFAVLTKEHYDLILGKNTRNFSLNPFP